MLSFPERNDLQLSDIIFSAASQQISRFEREATRSRLSTRSRLHSIAHDAEFVQQVAELFSLPLIANERCGSWYVAPPAKKGSVYFKSTDGHAGQWSLSLRRLNLNLLELIALQRGCIIVDSTRRGKSMPDALSKTVPIWIAVWNRLLFPANQEACTLRTPSDVVGASEHSQIEQRLDKLVDDLKSLDLDLEAIRKSLQKPLRPTWVTQSSGVSGMDLDESFYHVILCTASGRDAGQDVSGFNYVQGAADDAEAWALGLTPQLFWEHKDTLLESSEDDLPALITSLVSEEDNNESTEAPILIKPTQLLIGTTASTIPQDCTLIITCSPTPPTSPTPSSPTKTLHLPLPPGKLGSRALRHLLPQLPLFLNPHLSPTAKTLITCPSGKDHSIGVALCVLCLFATTDGTLHKDTDNASHMNKDFIKRRLSWIMASIPSANPSRATLQSVNAYLLG
ncbi:tRNA a64-2'-O-ribosylphosphate transferase [Elsinoe ampelina]|uniref:tRNA a64-2'-O-ribosylphosphate transferase n=1 Tax=Elsinoe ampelina TaxID=302913 RepID=A0A6A6FZF6_9PEZI|nr:tRNA a64-2'-O-ribosylphosphate transferase [Elsinoe ampelina]